MRRVTHLAHHKWTKGVSIKHIDRPMQKKAEKVNMEQRKRWNKLGRLAELHRRLARGQLDKETFSLATKLYDVPASRLDIRQVEEDKMLNS